MRVLVTGAGGFLGAAVAQALVAAGHQVRALVRSGGSRARLAGLPVDIVAGDVTAPESLGAAIATMAAVVHCAAVTESAAPERFVAVNVAGTRHVLAAARAAGVRRFVHASSSAAVGGGAEPRVFDETDSYGWGFLGSPYHDSKAAAELEVARAVGAGLDAVILNPVWILDRSDHDGRRGTRLLRDVMGHGGWLYPTGGVSVTRLDRVVEAFVAALDRGASGARYVLGGANVSYRELLAAVARRHGRREPWIPVGREVMFGAATASAVASRLLGRSVGWTFGHARGFGTTAWYDSSRAVRELGYRPPSLDEVLDALG